MISAPALSFDFLLAHVLSSRAIGTSLLKFPVWLGYQALSIGTVGSGVRKTVLLFKLAKILWPGSDC